MPKEFLCSNESVNSYGFRVQTSGISLKNFKKNPVGFFNHLRGNDWFPDSTYKGPIIRWENLRIDGSNLYATPIFDTKDEVGKAINDKVEDDFIRAASIGFRIIETSNDPDLMEKGQTGPTVTKCELIEISVVDIGSNKEALALYDSNGNQIELKDDVINTTLSAVLKKTETLPKNNIMKLKLQAAWTFLAAALGFETGKDQEVETTPEKLAEINNKLSELAELKTSNSTLLSEKQKLAGQVTTLTSEKDALSTKVTGLETQLVNKDTEITSLKNEVTALKKPADPIVHPIKNGDDPSKKSEQLKETETSVDLEAKQLVEKYGNLAAEKAAVK